MESESFVNLATLLSFLYIFVTPGGGGGKSRNLKFLKNFISCNNDF